MTIKLTFRTYLKLGERGKTASCMARSLKTREVKKPVVGDLDRSEREVGYRQWRRLPNGHHAP